MMPVRRSIAVRLAAMFALAALAVFSLLGWTLDRELGNALARQQAEQLDSRFQDVDYAVRHLRVPEQWGRLHAKMDALTPPDHSTRYWILSDDLQIRYGDALAEIAAFETGRTSEVGRLRIAGHREPMLVRSDYLAAEGGRAALRLVVGIDSASYARTQRAFRSVLVAGVAGGVLLVAGLGFVVAQFGLVPLKRLSHEASALSPSTLSQRLQAATLPAELSELARSFNGALDRLETAYQQLESFNVDVTHELRTPLSNLIGQTQVALSRQRGAAELQEVLQSNLEELERLRAIVNDMLFLARADLGERPQQLKAASLAAEVRKSAEFLDFLMDDAGVSVRVQGDAQASIDGALFGRAVTNLLHNAIRHADSGSEIVVALSAGADEARVAVSNPGPEIPEEHVHRIFDRFYRVDTARSNSGENHGLGLAIVKAVAVMHGGRVFASSGDGVTTVGFSVATALSSVRAIQRTRGTPTWRTFEF